MTETQPVETQAQIADSMARPWADPWADGNSWTGVGGTPYFYGADNHTGHVDGIALRPGGEATWQLRPMFTVVPDHDDGRLGSIGIDGGPVCAWCRYEALDVPLDQFGFHWAPGVGVRGAWWDAEDGYPDYGAAPVDYLNDDPELDLRAALQTMGAAGAGQEARARSVAAARRTAGLPPRKPAHPPSHVVDEDGPSITAPDPLADPPST